MNHEEILHVCRTTNSIKKTVEIALTSTMIFPPAMATEPTFMLFRLLNMHDYNIYSVVTVSKHISALQLAGWLLTIALADVPRLAKYGKHDWKHSYPLAYDGSMCLPLSLCRHSTQTYWFFTSVQVRKYQPTHPFVTDLHALHLRLEGWLLPPSVWGSSFFHISMCDTVPSSQPQWPYCSLPIYLLVVIHRCIFPAHPLSTCNDKCERRNFWHGWFEISTYCTQLFLTSIVLLNPAEATEVRNI